MAFWPGAADGLCRSCELWVTRNLAVKREELSVSGSESASLSLSAFETMD